MSGETAAAAVDTNIEETQSLLTKLRRELTWVDLANGRWFEKMVYAYLDHYKTKRLLAQELSFDLNDPRRLARTRTLIRKACLETTVGGGLAAAAVTEASVLSSNTGGAAGLVAYPVAGLLMGGELLYRTIVHLRLICDLGNLYGYNMSHKDEHAEVWRMCALAFQGEGHRHSGDFGKSLVVRVIDTDPVKTGKTIASNLLSEAALRNFVPFVGIAASATTNWWLTRRLGLFSRRCFMHRRAVGSVVSAFERRYPQWTPYLIEGIWHVVTADGEISHEEAVLLARLAQLTSIEDSPVTELFKDDESEWLKRLRFVEEHDAQVLLLRGLEVAATVSGGVSHEERNLLEHAAAALKRPLPLSALDDLSQRFRAGALEIESIQATH